mmetsp:Transcript_7616/g.26812  ORF Transcript_7616/g.26812 Transcript_7616/m.26812 type:complete len:227 (+) Transcript_7616:609-1289(+)
MEAHVTMKKARCLRLSRRPASPEAVSSAMGTKPSGSMTLNALDRNVASSGSKKCSVCGPTVARMKPWRKICTRRNSVAYANCTDASCCHMLGFSAPAPPAPPPPLRTLLSGQNMSAVSAMTPPHPAIPVKSSDTFRPALSCSCAKTQNTPVESSKHVTSVLIATERRSPKSSVNWKQGIWMNGPDTPMRKYAAATCHTLSRSTTVIMMLPPASMTPPRTAVTRGPA